MSLEQREARVPPYPSTSWRLPFRESLTTAAFFLGEASSWRHLAPLGVTPRSNARFEEKQGAILRPQFLISVDLA